MPGGLERAGSALLWAGTDPCSCQDPETATTREESWSPVQGVGGPHGPWPWVVIAPCPLRLEGTRCAWKWHRRGDSTVSLWNTAGWEKGPLKSQRNIPALPRSTDPSPPWKTDHSSSDISRRHQECLTLAATSIAWSPTALRGGRGSVSTEHLAFVTCHSPWHLLSSLQSQKLLLGRRGRGSTLSRPALDLHGPYWEKAV